MNIDILDKIINKLDILLGGITVFIMAAFSILLIITILIFRRKFNIAILYINIIFVIYICMNFPFFQPPYTTDTWRDIEAALSTTVDGRYTQDLSWYSHNQLLYSVLAILTGQDPRTASAVYGIIYFILLNIVITYAIIKFININDVNYILIVLLIVIGSRLFSLWAYGPIPQATALLFVALFLLTRNIAFLLASIPSHPTIAILASPLLAMYIDRYSKLFPKIGKPKLKNIKLYLIIITIILLSLVYLNDVLRKLGSVHGIFSVLSAILSTNPVKAAQALVLSELPYAVFQFPILLILIPINLVITIINIIYKDKMKFMLSIYGFILLIVGLLFSKVFSPDTMRYLLVPYTLIMIYLLYDLYKYLLNKLMFKKIYIYLLILLLIIISIVGLTTINYNVYIVNNNLYIKYKYFATFDPLSYNDQISLSLILEHISQNSKIYIDSKSSSMLFYYIKSKKLDIEKLNNSNPLCSTGYVYSNISFCSFGSIAKGDIDKLLNIFLLIFRFNLIYTTRVLDINNEIIDMVKSQSNLIYIDPNYIILLDKIFNK